MIAVSLEMSDEPKIVFIAKFVIIETKKNIVMKI